MKNHTPYLAHNQQRLESNICKEYNMFYIFLSICTHTYKHKKDKCPNRNIAR